jgi:hypothetical protein
VLSGRVVAVVGLVAALGLTGCYGSTEPATDVGPESATLRAHGTANNGPASSSFSYWLTNADRIRHGTPVRSWPAGASGPITERVSGLAAGSSYSFKVCGRDEGGEDVCAQTRTFTTKPPVEDALMGYAWVGCCSRFTIDAHSGPDGENPRGQVIQTGSGPTPTSFTGSISCLAVDGNRAAAGAVGNWRTGSDPPRPGTLLLTIEDRVAQTDTAHTIFTDGSTPPNCAGASFANQGEFIIPDHEMIVNDAP